jgi:hypothetical protein
VSCDDDTNHLAFCWTENISAPNLSYAAQYLAYALPYPIQSPYVFIGNRQAEIMMRIASKFGFTQASKSRISTPIKSEPNLFDLLGDSKSEPDR